jgi:mRNA-degrading endonuclease RelE of RelBE toxin-antitoxin system
MDRLLFSRRAERDLRRLGPGPELDRIHTGLEHVTSGDPNLDIKSVTGRPPWLRLRIGDWRILYRPADEGILAALFIHRSELEQAIRTLE